MNGGVEEFTDPMGNHEEHPRAVTNLWKDTKERISFTTSASRSSISSGRNAGGAGGLVGSG
jgi:hypothetical protein